MATKLNTIKVFDFVRVETLRGFVYHGEVYSVDSKSGIELQVGSGRRNLHHFSWNHINRIVGVDTKDLLYNGLEYKVVGGGD